ncbi:hypothetical protein [Actinoallomurus rhizosphaericola]|uniref:hypothetical protein n=1 Tax=Actinoallomurus rhizosphaericola TaxID=2952536 RepID=UPI0020909620|nr:hypothetical protein [Actinoallomurus rhizosphaericola]MCO5994142.1 hypothetical protein [Actinoallomurus rhizosphaericola]
MSAITIVNLVIFAAVLIKDWGHNRITMFAVLRPLLLTAVIVPFFLPKFDTAGGGLALEAASIGGGIVLGALACALLRVSVDESGQGWYDAGWAYVAVWTAITVLRQLLIYGCQHWFARDLGRFLIDHHISVAAFADSILFFTLTLVIITRVGILLRSRMPSARSVPSAA